MKGRLTSMIDKFGIEGTLFILVVLIPIVAIVAIVNVVRKMRF